MNPLFCALTAFVLVSALAPIVRKAALRFQLFDPPGPLKIHTQPVARLGGVAITLGFLVALSSFWPYSKAAFLPLLASVLLIWIVGLWDDVRGLSPAFRLVAQLAAAAIIVGGELGWSFGPEGIALRIFACLFIVIFINAFNFLDGSDGLAAGVAALNAVGFILLSDSPSAGTLTAWALLGSCLGFLLSNFPPAKIFMGDSGSTTLGFVVAYLSLHYYSSSPGSPRPLVVPLFFAALPLIDLALAILRRFRSGGSIFLGDRRHIYDLLLQRGWSQRRVALSFYLATGLLLIPGLWCGRWIIRP